MIATISRNELKAKIDGGDIFKLVETLPPTMYHAKHLPDAINMPLTELAGLAPTLLPDKQAEIIVYCASPT